MKDGFLRFTSLITEITRNIRKMITDAVARYDIKRSYAMPIYFLYRNGPLSATKLCKLCAEDKANVSRTLRALEEEGYIVREERVTARSKIRMTLSAEGMEIGEFLARRMAEAVKFATDGVSPEDIETMYSVLERIHENLLAAPDKLN